MAETYAEPVPCGVGSPIEQVCRNCGDEVIRNYDGRGTGWSHIYPEGHPLWLRSGTKQCRTPTGVRTNA
jgi:hypothetical protein